MASTNLNQQQLWQRKVRRQALKQGLLENARLGACYEELLTNPNDVDIIIDRDEDDIPAFESACRHGPISDVQSMVSDQSPARTRFVLHHGLVAALGAGNVDATRCLLSVGAPIIRRTPGVVLGAAQSQQIPLFDLLLDHGWTVNSPGYYGAVLLPQLVSDLPLLQWFLNHGADPNLGEQLYFQDRFGGPKTDSCLALETAAQLGSVEAARLLLDAGAKIQNGAPLHFAAGLCPPGSNPYYPPVTPSKEFDRSRIPVMALLVERGADVNHAKQTRYVESRYAITKAVMAGAVERVRWLLERGADAELKGPWGSAVDWAMRSGSEEMRLVIDEMVLRKKRTGRVD